MSTLEPKDDDPKQHIVTLITEHLRVHFKREPLPEEIAAALDHRRASLIEHATPPDAARIEAAANANRLNDAAPGHSRGFDDCKAPALWTEPERPKCTTTPQKINEWNRAKWADPASDLDQAVMADERAESLKSVAAIKAAAEVRVSKAVSDFQSGRARKPRPKKKPTHRSEAISRMRRFRAEGHTLPDFTEADHDGLTIRSVLKGGVTRYRVENGELRDKKKRIIVKFVARSTLDAWWTAAKQATVTS
jgi:hypothetical protein